MATCRKVKVGTALSDFSSISPLDIDEKILLKYSKIILTHGPQYFIKIKIHNGSNSTKVTYLYKTYSFSR